MRKPKSKDPKAPYVTQKTPYTKVEHLLKKAQTDLKKLQEAAEAVKMDIAPLERVSAELEAFSQNVSELDK